MKRCIALLLGIIGCVVVCSSVTAQTEGLLTVCLPHLTGGPSGIDWTDYLQADNNGADPASFTLTVYDGISSTPIFTKSFTVPGRSKFLIDIKKEATSLGSTGVITYTDPALGFRLSYEYKTGGLAEFYLTDTLKTSMVLYFSEFSSVITTKGVAIANMTSTQKTVTMYAVGGGQILGQTQFSLFPFDRTVGGPSTYFGGIPGIDAAVEKLIVVADTACLDGLTIGTDATLAHAVFIPGQEVHGFFSLYTMDDVETKIIASFGEDDGFDAIVLALDKGYSITQIVVGLMAESLLSSGTIEGSDGLPLTPKYTPTNLILLPTPAYMVSGVAEGSVPAPTKTLDELKKECQTQDIDTIALIALLLNGYSLEQTLTGLFSGNITLISSSFGLVILDNDGSILFPEKLQDKNAGGLVEASQPDDPVDPGEPSQPNDPNAPSQPEDPPGIYDINTGTWSIVNNHPLYGDFDWYTFRFWESVVEGHQGDGDIQVLENDTATGYYDVTGSQVFIQFTRVNASGTPGEEEYEGTFIDADTIQGTWRKKGFEDTEWVTGFWTGKRNY